MLHARLVVAKLCSNASLHVSLICCTERGSAVGAFLLLLVLLPISATPVFSMLAGVLFLVVPFGFGNSEKAPLDQPSSADTLHPVLPGKHILDAAKHAVTHAT